MAWASSTAAGVSSIAQSCVRSGHPAASMEETSSRTCSAEATFGTRIASGPATQAAARSRMRESTGRVAAFAMARSLEAGR